MAAGTIAAGLADYALALGPDDVDDATAAAARERLLDSVACAVAAVATDEPAIERLLSFCAPPTRASTAEGSAGARILGTGRVAPVERAAMANAALIRYLDWNDTYFTWNEAYDAASAGHPSGTLGALLAAAAAHDRDGAALEVATVLAYELSCRVLEETAFQADGLDHANAALIAATLAGGRLAGCGRDALVEAVNVALAGHVSVWQSRAGELSDWKGFAVGEAVRNGLEAVQLARLGVTGPTPIVEGRYGLSNLLAHPLDLDPAGFGGNGGEFLLGETALKPFPVCGGIQAPVVGALSIVADADLDPGDVEALRLEVPAHTVDVCTDGPKWAPADRNTADHSLPYCVARALVDGEVTPRTCAPASLADDRVGDLVDRTTVVERAEPVLVRVETDAGAHEAAVDPQGYHDDPVAERALRRKHRVATAGSLPTDALDELRDWVAALDRQPSVDGLFDLVDVGG